MFSLSAFSGRYPAFISSVPFRLFVLTGLIPWTFFSQRLARPQQPRRSADLIPKAYAPRLILPLGAVGSRVVDLGIGIALLAVVAILFGTRPDWRGGCCSR